MINFIADICSNHNQDLNRTLKLIDKAKDSGCCGIKLQLFKANKLYAPEFKKQIQKMKKWEFSTKYLNDVSTHCNDIGIQFGCTPFYLSAVDELLPYVDFYKIGSYEANWEELIKKVQATKKSWHISTGMMKIINVELFLKKKYIRKNPPDVLFRCNSTYPAKPEDCNLWDVGYCYHNFKQTIGWSDHTGEPGVIHKAVNSGAKYIEFHLDLEDKKGLESEIGHCWRPSEIKKVIKDVEIGQKAEHGYTRDYDSEAKKWRTDTDGFRPLKQFRKELLNDN